MATIPHTAPAIVATETVVVDARIVRATKFALRYILPSIGTLVLALASGYKVYVNDAAKRDVQFVELKTKVEERDKDLERRLSAIERDTHDTREFLLNGRYPAATSAQSSRRPRPALYAQLGD